MTDRGKEVTVIGYHASHEQHRPNVHQLPREHRAFLEAFGEAVLPALRHN